MTRRSFVLALAPLPLCAAASKTPTLVRGTLAIDSSGQAVLRTSKGTVKLDGDEATQLVLHDARLAGADYEAAGQLEESGTLRIDPIHTRSMFVYRDGKRLAVSYWCDICYIRTWSPGKCWCCQEDTRLDPVDPATLDDANAKAQASGAGGR